MKDSHARELIRERVVSRWDLESDLKWAKIEIDILTERMDRYQNYLKVILDHLGLDIEKVQEHYRIIEVEKVRK